MGIILNTGVREIPIERNGKVVGSVRFSAADPSLLSRLKAISNQAEELYAKSEIPEDDLDKALDAAEALDKELRALLDKAFDAPVSEIVFGESFCFSSYGGKTLLEQFLEGVTPIIEEAMAEETKAVRERQDKYLSKYKK